MSSETFGSFYSSEITDISYDDISVEKKLVTRTIYSPTNNLYTVEFKYGGRNHLVNLSESDFEFFNISMDLVRAHFGIETPEDLTGKVVNAFVEAKEGSEKRIIGFGPLNYSS